MRLPLTTRTFALAVSACFLGVAAGGCSVTVPGWQEGPSAVEGASDEVIYGEDDRHDRNEFAVGAVERDRIDGTVALLDRGDVTWDAGAGEWIITTGATFGENYGLCPGEPFADQPNPAWCTGFPVASDKIATAGHCVDATTCRSDGTGDTAFVFDFHVADDGTVNGRVGPDDVYFCKRLIAKVENNTNDWGVVELINPLSGGHAPLPFRRDPATRVPDGAPLAVTGHPSGLPGMYAGGANVQANSDSDFFEANLDTYGGNSGSPVFNTDTGVVEGILVRGNTDFVWDGRDECYYSNECPDTGCKGTFEECTRVSNISDYVWDCGDGIVNGEEECDGAALGGASCAGQGCGGGEVTCTAGCALDFSGCTGCPVCNDDGVCDAGEDCNGCPGDCVAGQAGAVCGDGVCHAADGEDCVSCPADCNGRTGGKPKNRYCCGDASGAGTVGCGDNRCSADGNTCTSQPAGGDAYCCGDGTCGGAEACGNCAVGPEVCGNGADEDCNGATDCGDAACAAELECQDPCDNDGTCEPGEDCVNCPDDCDGKLDGKPKGRHCCGDGVVQRPERDGRCDGNN